MGKYSNTSYDSDKVLFNFSSYNLNDHEKSVLCKSLNFCYSTKNYLLSVQNVFPFKMLFGEITSLDISNFDKECVKSRLSDKAYTPFKRFSRVLPKIFPNKKMRNLITWLKIKT